ncbi:hypothetical protein [Wenyingzhuangia aestuarii]|uniref:hypothetical protein n=1 Tax=Wenyingzhuangia aestuarii TaxID=1647582 RepID=UPI00143ACF20|nr:hypothetical protein [Wenyingzhuangia aestuarii]NJB82819.1 hypothetical protein [Wenyingzhuangia aestuarii]
MKVIKNEIDLIQESYVEFAKSKGSCFVCFDNLLIDFELTLIDKMLHGKLFKQPYLSELFSEEYGEAIVDFELGRRTFDILDEIDGFHFKNCDFTHKLIFRNSSSNFKFHCCSFQELYLKDVVLEGKIRFYESIFEKSFNLENTTFKNLIDFWKSTFNESINFYKTDFIKTVVLAGCTFENNVLFTYTKVADIAIFRGAYFKKGLDLSLALVSGNLNLFDIQIDNKKFESHNEKDEKDYFNMVDNLNEIPLKNKRETYRIIKQYFADNGDDLHAVEFSKYEKETIKEILKYKRRISDDNPNYNLLNYIRWGMEQLSLWLNNVSNDYRNSYLSGLFFTIIVGLLFFTLSVLSLPNYCFEWNPFKWSMPEFGKYYMTFMNPTHDVDLFNELTPNGWTYFWQTWGRIFIGYGIYQTVQAFRKLK